MPKPKMVLHHNDPPCIARLTNGFCAECNLVPDTQSTCLWPYCPNCDRPLKKMKCPKCRQIFNSFQVLETSKTPRTLTTKGELLSYLAKEAKEYHEKALASIEWQKHMNNLSRKDFNKLKKNPKLTQRVVDALLVDFINRIGIDQGVDYGLYVKHLYG